MSKSLSTGWLVGAVVLVLSLGFAGAFIRIRPCRSCGGLAQELHLRTSPSMPPLPPPRVDCPDCSDRGKVPAFRVLIGYRVADSIAGLVRSCRDVAGKSALEELKNCIQTDGTNPGTFLFENSGVAPVITPRFIEANGSRYLLLLVCYPAQSTGDAPGTSVLLFSVDGPVLDRVDLLWSSRDDVSATVLDQAAPDGARITIHPPVRTYGFYTSYRLYQWRRPSREGFIYWTGPADKEDLCRLAIRESRLNVLVPAPK